MKKLLTLKWRFRYVQDGVYEPDRHNRWMMEGYLLIPTQDIEELEQFKDNEVLPGTVAQITMKGTKNWESNGQTLPKYKVRMLSVLSPEDVFNTGFGPSEQMFDSINACQNYAQDRINFHLKLMLRALNYKENYDSIGESHV